MDEKIESLVREYSTATLKGVYWYHVMVGGDDLDEVYKEIGDIIEGVSCDCDGNDNKYHKHFILKTHLKPATLQKRCNRHLKKINNNEKYYSKNKPITTHQHLIATVLYIWCSGKQGDHQHYNCYEYELSTRQKRALLVEYCEKYEDEFGTYTDLVNFIEENPKDSTGKTIQYKARVIECEGEKEVVRTSNIKYNLFCKTKIQENPKVIIKSYWK